LRFWKRRVRKCHRTRRESACGGRTVDRFDPEPAADQRLPCRLFTGLSLGSILLLVALGLAITYGLLGVINMAHGEMLMIGAYATFVTQQLFKSYAPGMIDWYLARPYRWRSLLPHWSAWRGAQRDPLALRRRWKPCSQPGASACF